MKEAIVKLPKKLLPVFDGPARYRCAWGGRGSGKSFSFALMAAIRGYAEPIRILCARELQNTIKDSVHSEIVKAIETYPWLAANYRYGESFIRGLNGTEFLFKGLRTNYQEIKSLSGIAICWVEEAEAVSESSWQVLIPTIRKPKSEVWATWNPDSEDSPVRKRFILSPSDNVKIARLNYCDNPWFPEVLEQERLDCLRNNPDDYAWIWEGECRTKSDAQVLNGKWLSEHFEPASDWDGPYIGADWGFANDPTTADKLWIKDRTLFVEYESHAVGLELDATANRWKADIPGIENYVVRADNSRPESISHVRQKGIPKLVAADKWPGSVEDGVAYLRSFDKIIIHPRCVHSIREARLYSYKVDRRTGDILPSIMDANNHHVDSFRYALSPMIRMKTLAKNPYTSFRANPTATQKQRNPSSFGR